MIDDDDDDDLTNMFAYYVAGVCVLLAPAIDMLRIYCVESVAFLFPLLRCFGSSVQSVSHF